MISCYRHVTDSATLKLTEVTTKLLKAKRQEVSRQEVAEYGGILGLSIFAYNNDNVSFFIAHHVDLFYTHVTTQSIRSKQKAFYSVWHYTWLDNGEQFCALSFHCRESLEICRPRTDSALPTRISPMGSSPFHDPVLPLISLRDVMLLRLAMCCVSFLNSVSPWRQRVRPSTRLICCTAA